MAWFASTFVGITRTTTLTCQRSQVGALSRPFPECSVAVSRLAGHLLEEFLSAQAPQAATSQGRGYINSQGEWVPSPTRTADGKPPTGATAHCRDGTFSFSRTRQGTCSHHGGVAEWLRE